MNLWKKLIGTGVNALVRKNLAVLAAFTIGALIFEGGPARATGSYYTVDYPASTVTNELRIAVTYTLWVPDGVKTIRGVIVHQHGAGMTASKEGSTAAYDLHWQALAKKWDCALLGPSYHVLNDGDMGAAGAEYWFDPRRGSAKTFLKALDDFAAKTNHPELAKVPWALWGHSAGAGWADLMATLYPERIVGVYYRSGCVLVWTGPSHSEYPAVPIPANCYDVPRMCTGGAMETWLPPLYKTTFQQYRTNGGPIGCAYEPRSGHECRDSRYFAIPFLDACLAMRLPEKSSKDQTLKPVDMSQAWLVTPGGDTPVPAADYKGKVDEAWWLPNEAVAKDWVEYTKTGEVGDTTPPPTPFNVKVTPKGDHGTEITWDAEADLESGIRQFILLRDGMEFARVPETPKSQYGARPLFQSQTYHDTPGQPMPDMRFLDTSVKPGEKHSYTVITVNSVGLESKPSQWQYTFEPQDYRKVLDNVADVAVDSKNNIYAIVRGDIPILVFNAKGKYLRGWGQGLIGGPHGIYIDSLDNVFCVDSKNHVVMKFTTGGKLLMTLGTKGVASNSGSIKGNFKTVKTGAGPFNVPTKVATSKSGDIFVTDGYGNARVHRFSADGKLIKSWGEPGTGPGQFNLPHGIAVDNSNNVYVADRENDRIQIFDVDGNLKKIWNDIYRPSAICFHNGYLYVTELGHRMYVDNVLFVPDGKGPWSRVRIFDTNGVEHAKFGEPEGWIAGNFFSPHGICVDKLGNVYIAEVIWPANESSPPKDLHPGLQKFIRQ